MPRFREEEHRFDSSVNVTDQQLTNPEGIEGEPDEQLECWVPHQMQDIDFSNEDEEDTDDPHWCFLCKCSQSKYNVASNEYLQRLIRFVDENWHLMAPKALTGEAQTYYNTNLRPYIDEQKVWRRETIYRHFDEHAPTSRIMHEDTLRTYTSVMRVLRDNGLFVKDTNSNRLNVDRKTLDMYIRVERQRTAILSKAKEQRPSTLL